MVVEKSVRRKFTYGCKRYWYHISSSLKKDRIELVPWDEDAATNRDWREPVGKRICVAPTIEQCLTAVPYTFHQKFTIYRTEAPQQATAPKDIFDSNITKEGWLTDPTTFVKVGTLSLAEIQKFRRGHHVITEAGSKNNPSYSSKVLRWWQKIVIEKYIKKS